jgi:hypothetical protein
VPWDIKDIGSPDELINYAVRAQVLLLSETASHHKPPSQNKIAQAIGMDTGNFARTLANGSFSDARLQKLDEVIVALVQPGAEHAGGLSSLAICLRGLNDRESLADRVPANWAQEILRGRANDEVGVLTQASALLSAFLAAEQFDKVDHTSRTVQSVLSRYREEIVHVVDQLIILGYAPPTPRSVESLILLGTLGGYATKIVKDQLEYALTQPLGFRVWRVITSLVMLSRRASHTSSLRGWVRNRLEAAEELRGKSLYAGRSLDLELALRIPPDWSPAEDDWARKALLQRATNTQATIRERGTAAMGLWQRAVENSQRNLPGIAAEFAPLITNFEDPAIRQDAPSGMRWAAATLRHVIASGVGICNTWPEIDEPWMQHVEDAVGQLQHIVPLEILPATRTLMRHSLMQNAEVSRRQAVEALAAGGWTKPVARAFERFLELERTESWVRIRALFALGFLQHRDATVRDSLAAACEHAYSNLQKNPTRIQIAEMATALFAVGDCFGAAGVPERDVRQMRDSICEILENLTKEPITENDNMSPVSRATAYLLTFMILPRDGRDEDLAEVLLKELSRHWDGTTRDLSRWALKNRIDETGTVKPLVHGEI